MKCFCSKSSFCQCNRTMPQAHSSNVPAPYYVVLQHNCHSSECSNPKTDRGTNLPKSSHHFNTRTHYSASILLQIADPFFLWHASRLPVSVAKGLESIVLTIWWSTNQSINSKHIPSSQWQQSAMTIRDHPAEEYCHPFDVQCDLFFTTKWKVFNLPDYIRFVKSLLRFQNFKMLSVGENYKLLYPWRVFPVIESARAGARALFGETDENEN